MIIGGFDQSGFGGGSIGRSPFGVGSGFGNPNTGRMVLPIAVVAKNLTLQVDTPPGASKTISCTLYKNGSATALSVSITGSVDTFVADNTTAVPFAIGDEISFFLTASSGVAFVRSNWSATL